MKGSLIPIGVPPGFRGSCRLMPGSLPHEQMLDPLPFGVPVQKFQPWTVPRTKGPRVSAAPVDTRRCNVKGCVFPAASASDTCLQHSRQFQEPSLFCSRQPSMLLLDRAKFGLLDSEPDDARVKDRRRLAKIREHFLDGAV